MSTSLSEIRFCPVCMNSYSVLVSSTKITDTRSCSTRLNNARRAFRRTYSVEMDMLNMSIEADRIGNTFIYSLSEDINWKIFSVSHTPYIMMLTYPFIFPTDYQEGRLFDLFEAAFELLKEEHDHLKPLTVQDVFGKYWMRPFDETHRFLFSTDRMRQLATIQHHQPF